jgi:chemotaxis signal transduction protein
MSDDSRLFEELAARLRDDFDRSFAEPRSPERPAGDDLLAIRIGPEPYALRLAEVSGLYTERKITRLPGSSPALLGIAAFRGAIVPVYDLSVLLGQSPGEMVRWLAIAAGQAVAFALASVEGYLRVDLASIVPHEARGRERRHVRDFARGAGPVRPIVHLPSVIEAIRRHAAAISNQEP